MQIANEAYHYNMTLSVAGASTFPSGLATRFSPIFAPRFVATRNSVDVFPELNIRLSKLAQPEQAVLSATRDPSIRNYKEAYLDSRDSFRSNLPYNRNAVDDYAAALSNHFSSLPGGAASRITTVTIGIGAAAVGAIGATAAGPLGIAVALVGFGLSGLSTVESVYGPHALSWWRELNVNNPVVVSKPAPAEFGALEATGTTWVASQDGAAHQTAVAAYSLD